jgi:hypothetical protein
VSPERAREQGPAPAARGGERGRREQRVSAPRGGRRMAWASARRPSKTRRTWDR